MGQAEDLRRARLTDRMNRHLETADQASNQGLTWLAGRELRMAKAIAEKLGVELPEYDEK